MLASVNVRTEFNTFLTQFAYSRERKYLKASAVCKHWTVKSVELMQSSSLFKDLKSRTQIKMIGVSQYNLCLDIVLQFSLMHCFNCSGSTNRHEYRSHYITVVCVYEPGTGIGL